MKLKLIFNFHRLNNQMVTIWGTDFLQNQEEMFRICRLEDKNVSWMEHIKENIMAMDGTEKNLFEKEKLAIDIFWDFAFSSQSLKDGFYIVGNEKEDHFCFEIGQTTKGWLDFFTSTSSKVSILSVQFFCEEQEPVSNSPLTIQEIPQVEILSEETKSQKEEIEIEDKIAKGCLNITKKILGIKIEESTEEIIEEFKKVEIPKKWKRKTDPNLPKDPNVAMSCAFKEFAEKLKEMRPAMDKKYLEKNIDDEIVLKETDDEHKLLSLRYTELLTRYSEVTKNYSELFTRYHSLLKDHEKTKNELTKSNESYLKLFNLLKTHQVHLDEQTSLFGNPEHLKAQSIWLNQVFVSFISQEKIHSTNEFGTLVYRPGNKNHSKVFFVRSHPYFMEHTYWNELKLSCIHLNVKYHVLSNDEYKRIIMDDTNQDHVFFIPLSEEIVDFIQFMDSNQMPYCCVDLK